MNKMSLEELWPPDIGVNASMSDRVTTAIDSSFFKGLLNAERYYAEFAIQQMTGRTLHSEEWEDSPDGVPQTKPYQWWRLHDEY